MGQYLLPDQNLLHRNPQYNLDANGLVKDISCDLLYLDPAYNSRQYSDAYHLLENIARWEKPKVYGGARKMNRDNIKRKYCLCGAGCAFADLRKYANTRYILLFYNYTSNNGSPRSYAKILDDMILELLLEKGDVKMSEQRSLIFVRVALVKG